MNSNVNINMIFDNNVRLETRASSEFGMRWMYAIDFYGISVFNNKMYTEIAPNIAISSFYVCMSIDWMR